MKDFVIWKQQFMKHFIVVNNRQNITTEVANIKWWQKKEKILHMYVYSQICCQGDFFSFFL